MAVELESEAKDFVEIQLPGRRAPEYLHEGGVVLRFEFFDAKGVAPLVGGFGELIFCAKNEFLFCVKGVGAKAHHDGIEIAGAGIEMAAGREEVEQMHVVHNDQRVGPKRIHYQLVK